MKTEQLIKNVIRSVDQTKRICEYMIAYEPISESSQRILASKAMNCELQIQLLNMELDNLNFKSNLYNICNPERSVKNV